MHRKHISNIILFLLLPVFIFSQNYNADNEFTSDSCYGIRDSLIGISGHEKIFIPEYELQTLMALSQYPELDSTAIEFKNRKMRLLGNARPKMDFLFRKKENRHYVIIVNNNSKKALGFAFSDIPFNAQIGFFGHELAHIADYSEKNNLRLILFGARYLFMQKNIERYTDKIAIHHNLGRQLYKLTDFIMKNPDTSKDYLKFKRNNYLNCEEILHEISILNDNLPDR